MVVFVESFRCSRTKCRGVQVVHVHASLSAATTSRRAFLLSKELKRWNKRRNSEQRLFCDDLCWSNADNGVVRYNGREARCSLRTKKRRRYCIAMRAVPIDALVAHVTEYGMDSDIVHHHVMEMFDVAVGVGLPCTVMNCGDVVYRASLDPVLRMEERSGLTPGGALLIAIVLLYLFVTPGPGVGFVDTFLLAPIDKLVRYRRGLNRDEFVTEKKLGEGGFGTVYRAVSAPAQRVNSDSSKSSPKKNSNSKRYVLKKALEFGRAEEWMNLRVSRECPGTCADFVGAFSENTNGNDGNSSSLWSTGQEYEPGEEPPLWLLWRYEGELTLDAAMQSKNFPFNIEKGLLSKQNLNKPRRERNALVIKTIAAQMLKGLRKLHSVGIVHRDVKPENLIMATQAQQSLFSFNNHNESVFDFKSSENDYNNSDEESTSDILSFGKREKGKYQQRSSGIPNSNYRKSPRIKVKFIDLGGAADLRLGINYTPREILLDPRYAAPEQYIMSTQTPNAPPALIALLLSPVLWQLNVPDRFDIYSASLVVLQMIFPDLRRNGPLKKFRELMDSNDNNIYVYREMVLRRSRSEVMKDGVAILDADGGAGWDMLSKMMTSNPDLRVSASGALAHPFFKGVGIFDRFLGFLDAIINAGVNRSPAWLTSSGRWLDFYMAKSGTKNVGGFTEAQLEKFKAVKSRRESDLKAGGSGLGSGLGLIKGNNAVSTRQANRILGDKIALTIAEARFRARKTVRNLNLRQNENNRGGGGSDSGAREFIFFPWQRRD